jgi:hypothetical protein
MHNEIKNLVMEKKATLTKSKPGDSQQFSGRKRKNSIKYVQPGKAETFGDDSD